MLVSFIIGVLLGVYTAKAIEFSNKYKKTKYEKYIKFIVLISISILGPAAVYLTRALYGTGPDGDPPLSIVASFGVAALLTLFVMLYYQSKK